MASQLEKMKRKGRAKEELSQNARGSAMGLDARYGSGNMMLISIDLLEVNEKNTRDIRDDDESIRSLMQSIEDIGLQQNLVVYQIGSGEEKRFRLLSGHRRFCALKQLHKAYPDNEKYSLIPCLIVTLNGDLEKDISPDLEEEMYIAVTNVEVEGLTRKELLNSVRICMTYYEKKHAGEKKISGTVKTETANKLGISQRMLYDILKIDSGLIPELHQMYFEADSLQHRAARMLAGYSDAVQYEIYEAFKDHADDLGEERIRIFLGESEFIRKKKAVSEKKQASQPDPVFTKVVYSDGLPENESKRVTTDETGKRIIIIDEPYQKKDISFSPETDLQLLIPENLKKEGIDLNRSDYKKYIKAMNVISKQMALIAELIENR